MNYSTRVRAVDLPTLQSKNAFYTYTAIYFTHTHKIQQQKNLKDTIKDTVSALLMRTLHLCYGSKEFIPKQKEMILNVTQEQIAQTPAHNAPLPIALSVFYWTNQSKSKKYN